MALIAMAAGTVDGTAVCSEPGKHHAAWPVAARNTQVHHMFDVECFGCCVFRNLRLLPNILQCPPIWLGDPMCGHTPQWTHLAFKTLNMSYLHVNYNQSCLVSKEMPEARVDVTFVSCDRGKQKKKKKPRSSTVVKDELTGGDHGITPPHTHTLSSCSQANINCKYFN